MKNILRLLAVAAILAGGFLANASTTQAYVGPVSARAGVYNSDAQLTIRDTSGRDHVVWPGQCMTGAAAVYAPPGCTYGTRWAIRNGAYSGVYPSAGWYSIREDVMLSCWTKPRW